MPAKIIVLVLLSDLPFSFGKSGNDIIVVHDQGFTLFVLFDCFEYTGFSNGSGISTVLFMNTDHTFPLLIDLVLYESCVYVQYHELKI